MTNSGARKPSLNGWNGEDRTLTLWVAVFGIDGTNGLKGTTKEHAKALKNLQAWQSNVDNILSLTKWAALGFASLSGFLFTDTFAKILKTVLIMTGNKP